MSQSETEVSPEDAMDTLKRQLGGQGLLVAAIIMLILTLAWTAMRIAARRIGGHKFLAADYFYFASQLGYIGVFTSAMISELPPPPGLSPPSKGLRVMGEHSHTYGLEYFAREP
jgi:hypothetical protein